MDQENRPEGIKPLPSVEARKKQEAELERIKKQGIRPLPSKQAESTAAAPEDPEAVAKRVYERMQEQGETTAQRMAREAERKANTPTTGRGPEPSLAAERRKQNYEQGQT